MCKFCISRLHYWCDEVRAWASSDMKLGLYINLWMLLDLLNR